MMVQGWGCLRLTEASAPDAFWNYQGGLSPLSDGFDCEAFCALVDAYPTPERKSVKQLIVSGPCIQGLGNGYLQDVLLRARLHPTRKVADLTEGDRSALYEAVQTTMTEAIAARGRDTERDLHNQPGGYTPLLDKRRVGKPCPVCDTAIEKISYLGGSCYFCPTCQPT
jgi:formamidopyrimidine-DNA glycosylase